jgi:hypothetical protein
LVVADYLPQFYWSGVALPELETWIRAHVPSEMGSFVDRGMDTARFRVAEKQMLTAAMDSYLHK